MDRNERIWIVFEVNLDEASWPRASASWLRPLDGRAVQAAEVALTFVNIADGRNMYASGSAYGATGDLNDF